MEQRRPIDIDSPGVMPDPGADDPAAQLCRRLRLKYAEVMTLETLSRLATARNLSGLFVPAASQSYLRSSTRLMIVGRETAGWRKLRTQLAALPPSATVVDYLQQQMVYHQQKVQQVEGRSKFFQFYRAASAAVAAPDDRARRDAPIWSNLFCFDEGKTRPDRKGDDEETVKEIVDLSFKLLEIQIAVFEPQVIVFTTGTSCDHYLRERLTERQNSTVLIPRQLWRFELPLSDAADAPLALAYRTPHPRHSATRDVRAAILADLGKPGALQAYRDKLPLAA